VSEQQTNPEGSRQRSEWDIGAAMSGFMPGQATEQPEAEDAAQELEADEALDDTEHAEADEAEEEDVSEDEDAEPEEEEVSEEPFLTLVVNGEERPVADREEATSLAQKGLHYTQEMQQLREEQRKWEGEREQITAGLKQQEGQYAQALETLASTFGAVLGEEPDWSALYQQDPESYAQQRAQWDNLAAIRNEQQRITREQQEQQQKQWQDWVQDEKGQLEAKKPEWTQPEQRQKDWNAIREYGQSQGLTDAELSNLYDHRFFLILHDAARYRQAQTNGKKKAKQAASRTVAPGTGDKVNSTSRQYRKEREKLKATGSEAVAANLFQQMLTKKG
jgi:hypothetical protein